MAGSSVGMRVRNFGEGDMGKGSVYHAGGSVRYAHVSFNSAAAISSLPALMAAVVAWSRLCHLYDGLTVLRQCCFDIELDSLLHPPR